MDSIITDPPYGLQFMGKEWDKFKEVGTSKSFGRGEKTGGFMKDRFRYGLPRYNTNQADFQQFTFRWATQCFRVLKPGGYLLSFGGTRTYHRMACAIEDAGFEIRDCIMWIYGSGFPKSLDISKAIDKMKGAERKNLSRNPNSRENCDKSNTLFESGTVGKTAYETEPVTSEAKQWEGWGTALKPAYEPIVVARKPLSEKTVAKNVLRWGTGGINIDACRIKYPFGKPESGWSKSGANGSEGFQETDTFKIRKMSAREIQERVAKGRFPANLILDEGTAELLNQQSGKRKGGAFPSKRGSSAFFGLGDAENRNEFVGRLGDMGGASRFFYVAKASRAERNMGLEVFENTQKWLKGDGGTGISARENIKMQNNHPTVKPLKLMEYLIKLVTPPKGTVLDPFLGSGTTAIACKKLGFNWIGIEKEKEYCQIAEGRIKAQPKPLL